MCAAERRSAAPGAGVAAGAQCILDLAQNDPFRVVLATWRPGQRDAFHSHPTNAAYRLTDCDVRNCGPDDKLTASGQRKAGSVDLQVSIASHSFENAGSTVCRILIAEWN